MMNDDEQATEDAAVDDAAASESARVLGARGAAKGGRARAEKLTPEERSKIAREAAEARWAAEANIPCATHGAPDLPLKVGDVELPCYVLADGRRMLVQGGMLTGLDMSQGTAGRGPGDRLAKFIAGKAINPFVPKELSDLINNPVKFRTTSGVVAYGYEATVLADLCDAVLEARKVGRLNYQTEHIAEQCEILVRGFARVGIIALIDEATGYQYDRARDALEEILSRFISKELLKWAKRFPDEFYEQMFRLKGWTFNQITSNRPLTAGKLTNNLIYQRLAPGVLDELKRITPRDANGRPKHKYHQRLTEDVGHPRLREHLSAVLALMRAADDWETFYRMIQRSLPLHTPMPLFDRDDGPEPEAKAVDACDATDTPDAASADAPAVG